MAYAPIDEDADGAYDTSEMTVDTLNGFDLSEIVGRALRVDGQGVFSFTPDHIIFDFSTNQLSQLIQIKTDGGPSSWSYSNNRVRADDDNANHIAAVDIEEEMSSSPTVSVSSAMDHNDNDGMGVVLVDEDLDQVHTLSQQTFGALLVSPPETLTATEYIYSQMV
jgi:restriction endonuclease Mrr